MCMQSSPTHAATWEQTKVGVGLLVIPQRTQLGFLLDAQFGAAFDFPKLCGKFQCHAAETKVRLAFGPNDYEHYIPYASVETTIVRFQAKEWLSWGGGVIRYFRNPKRMDTESLVVVSLGHGKVEFRRKNQWAEGGCGIRGQAVGVKSWRAFGTSEPFTGIHLLGLAPGCDVKMGNQKISFSLFAELSSDVSVGKSGDGRPDAPGSFGSLLSESWFEFGLRFAPKLPVSKPMFFYLQGDARYHILYNTGNKTLLEGIFVGLTTGFLF